jgi:hypothetical protein
MIEFKQHRDTGLFIGPRGYAVRRDGSEDYPPYWTAYRPDANGQPCLEPRHELGGGAGDEGFRKCIALCEREMRAGQQQGPAL